MVVRRHLWIFLLALLLPLAQVAAAAHELSHVQTAVETDSKSGLQAGHCDLCVLATQISGGAPSSPAKLQVPELRQIAPICQPASRSSIGVITGFDSRAPPNSLPL